MYQKNCTKCYNPSFSSNEAGEWLCPICGNDLTNEDFLDAMTREPVHISYRKKEITYTYYLQEVNKNYRKRIGHSYYSKQRIIN
jgi:uncharacterized Zn finger protein (UPF0148 family)